MVVTSLGTVDQVSYSISPPRLTLDETRKECPAVSPGTEGPVPVHHIFHPQVFEGANDIRISLLKLSFSKSSSMQVSNDTFIPVKVMKAAGRRQL